MTLLYQNMSLKLVVIISFMYDHLFIHFSKMNCYFGVQKSNNEQQENKFFRFNFESKFSVKGGPIFM